MANVDPRGAAKGSLHAMPESCKTSGLLDELLERLSTGLQAHMLPGTGLLDPSAGLATPPDHYGQTASALALSLLNGPDSQSWHVPFDAWQAIPDAAIGHPPFNRFLLGRLAERLKEQRRTDERLSAVLRAMGRCRLQCSYPSNNWVLLARLCELLEAEGSKRATRSARLLRLFDRWLTPGGGFVDYPSRPGSPPRGATPIAYHHKALFVAAAAAAHTGDDNWHPYLARLLAWSLQAWDGYGHAGGFGRSTHSLFGDACLVASLILLGAGDDAVQNTPAARMLRGVLQRWMSQFRADSLLGLNPADLHAPGSGWDGYMYLSVYNAWAAAIVSWARHRTGHLKRPTWRNILEVATQNNVNDLDIQRRGNAPSMLALISVRGQPPQAFSRQEVELRYAGAIPFHVTWSGRVLCPAPARLSHTDLRLAPALGGWTPIFEMEGNLYGLTDFDEFQSEELPGFSRLTFEGIPRSLLKRAPSGWSARILAGLDWRLLGGALGRRRALAREKMPSLKGTVIITTSSRRPRITHEVRLEHCSQKRIRYLNPAGHALIADVPLQRNARVARPGAPPDNWGDAAPWMQCPLPSSIANAQAFCLPTIEPLPKRFTTILTLEWTL